MTSVTCTSSSEYVVPDDLPALPCVSNCLFKKPVTDLADLEKEILRVIEPIERKAMKDE